MIYEKQAGVPRFECTEFNEKAKDYVLLIPIINEGNRIIRELKRACKYNIADYVDIVICDGGSTDGCTEENRLRKLEVNSLLVKQDAGRQGAQLRMGIGGRCNVSIKQSLRLMAMIKTVLRMCRVLYKR